MKTLCEANRWLYSLRIVTTLEIPIATETKRSWVVGE